MCPLAFVGHLRTCPLCCVGCCRQSVDGEPQILPLSFGHEGTWASKADTVCACVPRGAQKHARGFTEDKERQLVWLTQKTNRAV